MATIVHLVRHGLVHNPEKILYGRLPGYRLSERGRNMAHATAAELADHDVVHLVASPLQRAQETARPFAEKLGLEITTDERVLEAGNQLEGLHIKGVRSALWNPKRWPMLRDPRIPSWGEPYNEIRDRMWEAIEDARVAARGHEAIIVSHQLPIVMIQRDAQGLPLAHNPAARQCDLASVTSLVFEGKELTDIFYAEPAQDI
ncbi:MAG TPA: histidine phosphatase family protein [Candidatus Corynebacterium gallistercoris]|uniref:Histidine phosphatase family protein n=1 Tax=Candidatus Corynebacterium gallistercoris TaxID=2838530 RepID=A0A9D1RZ09_9CORY|nr:histidine phosphatase family protein [Candidatus Corynebacterium gallistercoris]